MFGFLRPQPKVASTPQAPALIRSERRLRRKVQDVLISHGVDCSEPDAEEPVEAIVRIFAVYSGSLSKAALRHYKARVQGLLEANNYEVKKRRELAAQLAAEAELARLTAAVREIGRHLPAADPLAAS